ncbi:aldo/keto reductase [Paenibacillus yanchengensis]|uniref:Aldo/keto reductase n=1 Tax=Paenibacillus yanchengensis TaxID=2035833 RepID=A0ABW4YRD5_9BACL
MKYRKLGQTGLDVSALSFGASSLGSVFKEVDEGQAVRTVHTAVDAGINLIDVSPYYGLTKAETVLGKALLEIPRDKYYLSSKAGRYGADEFDFAPARLVKSVDESLQRLHVDYLDFLFLHDIEFRPLDAIVEESIPALERLKQQGKIRFAGISGFPMATFEKVLQQVDVDAILSYCHYSLNDNRLLELLPLLEEKQVALINASPLSMGLLSTQGPPTWHPAGAEIVEASKRAADFCHANGLNLSKLAVQYSLHNEKIPTTLVSTTKPENILQNIAWMNEAIDLDALYEVQKILQPIHNQTWISGLPENN